jgi:membrane fusion protein (multidrug efflux system)
VAALAGDPKIATDDHPAVRTALAALENAKRNLAKTTVIAPAAGIVSQVANLNVGQFIATGTTIATLVETDDTWIEANFKETQLASLTPGLPVEVTIDAYPGVKFEGKVQSIGAATGAEFALIPAQNATGNWVKVTQRVPVQIEVEPVDGKVLRAGMSAVVAVDTKPEQS